MKGPEDRTKVVLRHLPPSISQATLTEQIDGVFAGRYYWVAFHPGNSSQKCQPYPRAYVYFSKSDDVIEFAKFFDGHVFVKMRRVDRLKQFLSMLLHSVFQRNGPKKMVVRGQYRKPVENLPSAVIQLERGEAERAGSAKDSPIIMPLMNFVRLKRAAKTGSRSIV